ncbi:aldehyde dehydrogenase family protein, partial [Sediminivirga luteola]
MSDLPLIPHWINGTEHHTTGTNTAPVYNPATGEHTRNVTLATESDINTAITAAATAFPTWRDTSLA